MRSLSHADERRLKLVIEAGHALEKIWSEPNEDARLREHGLERLTSAVQALEQSEAENLRRLSFHTRNLSLEMTARHLATVLVPFERLQGKALRDDQILIDEGDTVGGERDVKPLRLIADNLRSAFNVGALLRTAECFGVEHVALTGYTPSPDTDKTARTSLGTEKSVSWSADANVHDVIARARADGYAIVALETAANATTLESFAWPEKCALIVGNERFGLDRDVLDQADHFVKIPMHGTKNSLNVGIATGIALAAWRSQRTTYEPIGVYRSQAVHPYEAPRQATVDESGAEGTIALTLDKHTLKDLEGFDRVWLIYDFHHNKSWKPLVLPPRGPHEKRGVFATRSPYRPNSIGLSCVELVSARDGVVTVKQSDLLDGTPILDIKPYLPYADSFPTARTGWLANIEAQKFAVSFAAKADKQLAWLEENGAVNIRQFLRTQLEFDPIDNERKRVSPRGIGYGLKYRTWRADFKLSEHEVTVLEIRTGYSAQDLTPGEPDKYGDKDLHRSFLKMTF